MGYRKNALWLTPLTETNWLHLKVLEKNVLKYMYLSTSRKLLSTILKKILKNVPPNTCACTVVKYKVL